MTLLRGLLGALTSSIIRLAILAGVLVAAWLLLLKPAIDSGERTVRRSLHSLEKTASPQRLGRCIERADGDISKMKRCTRLF